MINMWHTVCYNTKISNNVFNKLEPQERYWGFKGFIINEARAGLTLSYMGAS